MQVLARSRLTTKEQLSLPAAIRRLLGIQAGDEIVWMRDAEGRLLVEPSRRQTLADIRASVAAAGLAPAAKKAASVKDMKAGIAAHVKAKHGRR